jgi:precorrin-6y C5,15-methyltransferase (decarboxylating), CbiE subunit/precorrin-6Y C5,15-methyltransferase (decarboxylating), CbiT subunit
MNTTPDPVHVLGLAPGSLIPPPDCAEILARARVLVGGKRLLEACGRDLAPRAERRLPVSGPLDAVLRDIESETMNGGVVVLADGDPLFYGLGKRLLEALGPARVVFHPNVSTLQLAAARLKFPWQEAATVSLHGRSDYAPLFSALVRADHVLVFTDEENTPQAIARALLERGTDGFSMSVLENLGAPEERVQQVTLEEAWDQTFAPLNVVVFERQYPPEIPPCLGTPDHYFFHEKELITKLAVRAAGLALLSVAPQALVWDLGAGCGSVSIEASHLASRGRVYAVEKNRNRAAMIRENVRRMGAWAVETVQGEMPGCLKGLPDPDRVFIGGGLGQDNAVLEEACRRLKSGGRVVIHCILLDTLHRAKGHLEQLHWNFGVTQLQASTSDRLAGDLRFRAQNPVFILWAEKP